MDKFEIIDYSFSISEVLVSLLSLLIGALVLIIKNQYDKNREIRNQLNEKKHIFYRSIFEFFFDLFKEQLKLQTNDQNELKKKLIAIKMDIYIYAPDKVAKKFLQWNKFLDKYPNNPQHLELFLELFILIRKDIGHKTSLTKYDFLRSMMQSEEEYNNIKNLVFK